MTCKISECAKPVLHNGVCRTHYNRIRIYGDPHTFKRIRHTGTPEERFWQKVDKSGDCWLWRGHIHRNGYGSFWTGVGTREVSHRLAYRYVIGAIPENLEIDHLCHNRACVNPGHMRLVTSSQNNQNMHGVNSRNRHGFRGVGLNARTGKYRVRVTNLGREHYGGEYRTPEEAGEAARQLRLVLFTHNDLDRR